MVGDIEGRGGGREGSHGSRSLCGSEGSHGVASFAGFIGEESMPIKKKVREM